MNFIMGVTKSWHRMSITDRGIWVFFAVNTIVILTLLKFVLLGK